MKNAIMHIVMVEFQCPYCYEFASTPFGSHMFEIHEIPDKEERCDTCMKAMKIPVKAKKLKEKK
jgi:hypothetical protein